MSSIFLLAALTLQVPSSAVALENAPPPLQAPEPVGTGAQAETGPTPAPPAPAGQASPAPEALSAEQESVEESCDLTTGQCRKRIKPVRKAVVVERSVQKIVAPRSCGQKPVCQQQRTHKCRRECRPGRSRRCR